MNSAIISFNDGLKGVIPVLKRVGVICGKFTHSGAIGRDLSSYCPHKP